MTDRLRPVHEVVSERTGGYVSKTTQWRWIRKGCRGIKLQAWYLAGRWWTTDAAFQKFLDDQTKSKLKGEPVDGPSDEDLKASGLM